MPVTAAPHPKVLVIHALRPTSRQTTIDHLLSFREHLPHCDVQYLHFQQPIPRELSTVAPDLLVVNYDYLNYRFSPLWPYIRKRHRDIARRANAGIDQYGHLRAFDNQADGDAVLNTKPRTNRRAKRHDRDGTSIFQLLGGNRIIDAIDHRQETFLGQNLGGL